MRPKHGTALNGSANRIGWVPHQLAHVRAEVVNWRAVSDNRQRRWSTSEQTSIQSTGTLSQKLNRASIWLRWAVKVKVSVKSAVSLTFFFLFSAELKAIIFITRYAILNASRKRNRWNFHLTYSTKRLKNSLGENFTHFSSDSTCFSLSFSKYVGFAAISHSSFGRHKSLKESLIFWFTTSMFFFCSSLCFFSVNALLKNFTSTLVSSGISG